ncbi:MAG: hypothetical protein ABW185_03850 [Sedimenticola sp.]
MTTSNHAHSNSQTAHRPEFSHAQQEASSVINTGSRPTTNLPESTVTNMELNMEPEAPVVARDPVVEHQREILTSIQTNKTSSFTVDKILTFAPTEEHELQLPANERANPSSGIPIDNVT